MYIYVFAYKIYLDWVRLWMSSNNARQGAAPSPCSCRFFASSCVQGYLAHKKHPTPKTLQ